MVITSLSDRVNILLLRSYELTHHEIGEAVSTGCYLIISESLNRYQLPQKRVRRLKLGGSVEIHDGILP